MDSTSWAISAAWGRGKASLRSRTTKRLPARWPGLSLFVWRVVFSTRTSGRDYLLDLLRRNVLDGDPLPGDGLGVFQSRQADIPAGDVQDPGDAVQGLPRADPFFLDQGVDVGAGAAGLIERQLFHDEILRPGLDDAAHAGEIRREKW